MNNNKYFTPQEAVKTLPLVRKIVSDILFEGRVLRAIVWNTANTSEKQKYYQLHLEKLDSYLTELRELNCDYKDFEFNSGLVDFPSIIDDEKVFLCWRSDEESILHYHTLEAGYNGRKLIPSKYF